jgi:threonylcarbamoyladenosine tRNA methylthiotransferase MtaB
MDWNHDLISLMREFGGTRLARHTHLPLQSGSDSVLRRMHRRYRPWHYSEKVHALFEAAGSDLTLGADIMAGFPGETDREFQETTDFLRTHPFGYLHLFPFSPRPGTPGWDLHRRSPVPAAVVHERMAALRRLATEKSSAHRNSFVGRRLECLTLYTPDAIRLKGGTLALSENFLPLELEESSPSNLLKSVYISSVGFGGALIGHLV